MNEDKFERAGVSKKFESDETKNTIFRLSGHPQFFPDALFQDFLICLNDLSKGYTVDELDPLGQLEYRGSDALLNGTIPKINSPGL